MEKFFSCFFVAILILFTACGSSESKDCATEGEGEVTITLNLVDGPVGKEFRVSLFRVEKDSEGTTKVEYLEGSAQGVFGDGESRVAFSNQKPGTYYVKIAPVEGCEAFDLEMEPVKLAGESLMIDSPCNVIEVSVEYRTWWDDFLEIYEIRCPSTFTFSLVTDGTWAWWLMFGNGFWENDPYCIILPKDQRLE